MKIYLSILLSVLIGAVSVSAATGSTSTGSTSTGSTSTGTTSTGTTSTGIVLPSSTKGAGGPTRAWNFTTSQFEMLPQCFPWIWASDYFIMNIADMYVNQDICRKNRAIDFRF